MSVLLYATLVLLVFATATSKFPSLNSSSILKIQQFVDARVSSNEVTYAVATKSNTKLQNFSTPIDSSKIKSQNPVIFIIHGWTNNGEKPWIQNLTNVLLKRSDCSVVSIDWRKPANDSYPVAVKNAKAVGE